MTAHITEISRLKLRFATRRPSFLLLNKGTRRLRQYCRARQRDQARDPPDRGRRGSVFNRRHLKKERV